MTRVLRMSIFAAAFTALLALPGCYVEPIAPGPPPPPRVVVMPARPGMVWVGGHWAWRGGRWVWINGRYEALRAGHRWVPGHWQQTPRGHRWVRGHWIRQ